MEGRAILYWTLKSFVLISVLFQNKIFDDCPYSDHVPQDEYIQMGQPIVWFAAAITLSSANTTP